MIAFVYKTQDVQVVDQQKQDWANYLRAGQPTRAGELTIIERG